MFLLRVHEEITPHQYTQAYTTRKECIKLVVNAVHNVHYFGSLFSAPI